MWFLLLPMGSCTQSPLEYPIFLRNLSVHPTEVPSKAIVGQVAPANQIPQLVLSTEVSGGSTCGLQKGWILEALNLQCLEEWPGSEQEQARKLLLKWEQLFDHSNLDLGKTSLIKHQIKLTDLMPFNECYGCIPPHMYDDVKAHLQEMLDIGAIRKLHSPWASVVVLVQKKDSSLRFCIDLRKLNNQTIKHAYLLPHIDETLNSLQGSQWFFSHSQDG